MDRDQLIQALDALLVPENFSDYAPNGLQVAGRQSVQTIATAVSACQQSIDQAVTCNADMLLVHHGFFWQGEDPRVIGVKKQRLQTLLAHDINLLAYHLPLDAHPKLGNNAGLAKALGLEIEGSFDDYMFYGHLPAPLPAHEFAEKINLALARAPLVIEAGEHMVHKVVWCSGAAQKYITDAAQHGADAYLSGEISENTVHAARELGIHYFACGHHATERFGVQALGQYLAKTFGLAHHYLDIDNPV